MTFKTLDQFYELKKFNIQLINLKMNERKKTGIWMDHAKAHIITLKNGKTESSIIESTFTHQDKGDSMLKGEGLMHRKEQHEQASYYKRISALLLDSTDVLLFGPTDAKSELHNLMCADPKYSKLKIEVMPADKMTDHQIVAFVIKHYSE